MREASKGERDRILKMLENQFDINKEEFERFKFFITSNERIFVFSCSNYPGVKDKYYMGCYFGRIENDGLRLSIEGAQMVAKNARKGVIEINDNEAERWVKGEDLESDVKGYVILKCGDLVLGCGRGNGKFIKNWIPKDRRLLHDI